jgi:hypothetical protein
MTRWSAMRLPTVLITLGLAGAMGTALAQWIPSDATAAQSTSVDKDHRPDPETRRREFQQKFFRARKINGIASSARQNPNSQPGVKLRPEPSKPH